MFISLLVGLTSFSCNGLSTAILDSSPHVLLLRVDHPVDKDYPAFSRRVDHLH